MNAFVDFFLFADRYLSIVGIVVIFLVAILFSENRSKINYKLVVRSFLLQCLIGFFILNTAVGQAVVAYMASAIGSLYEFAQAGSSFVFGELANPSQPWGVIFLVRIAPIIIFFGALMSLLFYLGVIQFFVQVVGGSICKLLGSSSAETLCAAGNSLLSQTESPLLIKHYLPTMTRSEILTVMVSGMATLSGSILAVYGSMGIPMMHLLTASFMAIPGSILISKILIPETENPETIMQNGLKLQSPSSNALDAISSGTTDGLVLAANVMAMLIAFISLMAFVNAILFSTFGFTLDTIFSVVFSWVTRLIGIPGNESSVAGIVLGKKLVINEFVAYLELVKAALSERSHILLTYALCGFANFSSIGIQIGGIGALVPSKRELLTKLGLIALLGGTLTNLLNAALANLLI